MGSLHYRWTSSCSLTELKWQDEGELAFVIKDQTIEKPKKVMRLVMDWRRLSVEGLQEHFI